MLKASSCYDMSGHYGIYDYVDKRYKLVFILIFLNKVIRKSRREHSERFGNPVQMPKYAAFSDKNLPMLKKRA